MSRALSLRAAFVAVFMISIFNLSIKAQPTRNWGQLQSDNYETIRNDFNDPDMIYAPFLYWFWDEPLDREKIRKMTHEILKQKFNVGYIFAHTSMADLLARTPGLEKAMDPHPSLPDEEWLSQEWFDAIRDVVEITKEANAYLTYADEYMWPSGRANGRVIKQHPELHDSNLDFSVKDVRGGEIVVLPGSFFTIAAKIEKPKDVCKYLYAYSNETTSLSGVIPEDVSGRKSIGQTILVEKPWLKRISLKTTSFFLETKTGFTLEARLNNPEGKLISRIYYGPGIHEYDNPGLEIHDVLPAGTTLYIGMIPDDGFSTREFAWWGKKGDPYPGGSAYIDGEKQADEVDRYLRLYYKLTRTTRDSMSSVDETMDPYFETEIKSSTLKFIGEGEEFTWKAPKGGSWRVYSFNRQDGNSVNYLDKRLASAFIEIAHKPYFENLGKYMGNVIPGAICDTEGSYGSLPWSAHLPVHYKEMTGHDIRLMMPLLIDKDIEGVFARARFDFMESVSDLYSSYFGEVNDYLEKHGLYYVSNLWEESLQWVASNVGDLMKAQRRFSLPGTDALTLKIYDPHDLAESHSVAAFEGRRLECEFMGAGGWGDLTMQNLKAGINAVTTWGANHIVPHALFMARKQKGNVWVPDYFDELPVWPYLYVWSDFIRRTSFINSQGNVVPDVLLLNPLSSAWALLGNPEDIWGPTAGNVFLLNDLYDKKVQEINRVYSDAIRQLQKKRIEYLIADGHYMNEMTLKDKEFRYNDFRFSKVIIPPMVVMPVPMAEKLVDFAKAGGTVYALGDLPNGSTDHGMNDRKMLKLMRILRKQNGFKYLNNGIVAEMNDPSTRLKSQISFVSGSFDMLQKHRSADGRHFFWLANNSDKSRSCEVVVSDIQGLTSVWDCETGEIRDITSVAEGSDSRIHIVFKPYEAYWLVIDPEKPMKAISYPQDIQEEKTLFTLEGDWDISINPDVQPNLEFPVDISDILEKNCIKHNLSLWNEWEEIPENFSGLIDYTKTFDLAEAPGRITIDLGEVYHFAQVWVNGEDLGTKLWPPHQFSTSAFKKGENTICIRVGNLVNNNYYNSKSDILTFGTQLSGFHFSSGLIGPVSLKIKI